jgi:hypothetical protein
MSKSPAACAGCQEAPGRMAGCQSTNHDECSGELWQCSACGKTVCYAEGTDNHPELCDDCWVSRFYPASSLEQGGAMKGSEWMDQLVYDLIEHYEAEVLASGLIYLELSMEGYGVLAIEEKIKHRQMCVTYWLYDAQYHPVPEPQLLFYLDDGGHWIPCEIRQHLVGHQVYATVNEETAELVVTDPENQASLAEYADVWAEMLRAHGWVGGAVKCITQPQLWPEEDAPFIPPSVEELWDWVDEYGQCQATDGCWCEADGRCEHGYPSWLVELGLL